MNNYQQASVKEKNRDFLKHSLTSYTETQNGIKT